MTKCFVSLARYTCMCEWLPLLHKISSHQSLRGQSNILSSYLWTPFLDSVVPENTVETPSFSSVMVCNNKYQISRSLLWYESTNHDRTTVYTSTYPIYLFWWSGDGDVANELHCCCGPKFQKTCRRTRWPEPTNGLHVLHLRILVLYKRSLYNLGLSFF